MQDPPIKYDRFGRMEYNPMFHENMNRPWQAIDEIYLIEWYEIIGAEEMSYAVGRTIRTVMQRVVDLRRTGAMVKPLKSKHFARIKLKGVKH